MYVLIFLVNLCKRVSPFWENSCSFGLRYVFIVQYISTCLLIEIFTTSFLSGDLFLIAPFPDRCLLVPSYVASSIKHALAHACRDHPDLKEVNFHFYLCASL